MPSKRGVILRRRKAISYIMSVAIMTFVTLAMASVVLVWSLGVTSTSQNTFSSAINANEDKAQERYTIEQVQFFSPSLSSVATGGSTTTISDSTQTWGTTQNGGLGQWANYAVTITSGTDAGQTRTIVSNMASQLTVTPAFTSPIDTTSHYTISSAPTGGYLCVSTNGCVLVYVRNVGSLQIVSDAVYVDNQLALQSGYATGGAGTVPATTGSRLSLGIQQLGSLAVAAPFALSPGTTYTISVSTTRGNVVTVLQTY